MGGGALNQTLTCEGNTNVTTYGHIIKGIVLLIIMCLNIIGNASCLVVFNSAYNRKHFMTRLRYAMTSLCISDLCTDVLVIPSTIYPAIKDCWPFGEAFCKIEAVMIAGFYFESSLNLVLIAIDRYCIIHLPAYNITMTSRRFLIAILSTWIAIFTSIGCVVYVGNQFFYDEFGINCEPYFGNPFVTLFILGLFYFLPGIISFFCYGSIYRTAARRKKLADKYDEKPSQKRMNNLIRTSKHMAAISLGYVCVLSPWAISQMLVTTISVKIPRDVDFAITWLTMSNSFINCLIYGLMNNNFRQALMRFTCWGREGSLRNSLNRSSKSDNGEISNQSTLVNPTCTTSPFQDHCLSQTKQQNKRQNVIIFEF